jgi:3-phosphoshikimate 1-carboxyvinyltransferase
MRRFGMKIEWKNERTLYIPGGQKYSPINGSVEGDYSNASFFAALNVLGGDVCVEGLDPDSVQGDKIFSKYFEMIKRGTPSINISDCPDLGPILFALAAANNGGVFTGTRRLRLKESDRGEAMAEELRKLGVTVTVGDNEITVTAPDSLTPPTEPLCGHNDHRIVMASAVILSLVGGEIDGYEAVSKSFPDFFEILSSLK